MKYKVFWSAFNNKTKYHISFDHTLTLCGKDLEMLQMNFLKSSEVKDKICSECLLRIKKGEIISEGTIKKRLSKHPINFTKKITAIPFSEKEIEFLKVKIRNFYEWKNMKLFKMIVEMINKMDSNVEYLIKDTKKVNTDNDNDNNKAIKSLKDLKENIEKSWSSVESYKDTALKIFKNNDLSEEHKSLISLEKSCRKYYHFLYKKENLKYIMKQNKAPF